MLFLLFSLFFTSHSYASTVQVVVEVTHPELLKDAEIRFDEETTDETTNDDDMITIGQPLTTNDLLPAAAQEKNTWKKIARGELISAGGQAIGLIFFLAMPSSISHWETTGSQTFWNAIPKNYRRAFTQAPVFDKDPFIVNYVAHPYSGSVYYNSVRSQGLNPLQSFAFAFAQSTMWEYLIEASMEQPSIQDLIATPVLGAVLGEATHQATRLMKRRGFNLIEKIAVTIINPAYVINNGYH